MENVLKTKDKAVVERHNDILQEQEQEQNNGLSFKGCRKEERKKVMISMFSCLFNI